MGGYMLQLRILLWKNFILKKRSPFVLMFELFIPLVLFIILILIRKDQPPRAVGAKYFTARPLPSAGVMSIMQAFCGDQSNVDHHGFANMQNATASTFLKEFSQIAHHNNFFDPAFTPQDMDHIPELYRSIIEDPASLHQTFTQLQDLEVRTLFTNWTALQGVLVKNMSLPTDDMQAVGNSKLNTAELYRILFGDDSDEESNDINNWHRRRRRSIPSAPLGDYVTNHTSDFVQQGVQAAQDAAYSAHQAIGDALKQQIPKTLSDMETLSDSVLPKPWGPDPTDPADPEDPYGDEDDTPFGWRMAHRGLLYRVLRNDPALLESPKVLDTLGALLGFHRGPTEMDPELVLELLKGLVLAPRTLHHIICEEGDGEELTRLLTPQNPSDAPKLVNTTAYLCNLDSKQWQQLSHTISAYINTQDLVTKFHLEHLNLTLARQRVKIFTRNLREFVLFEKNLMQLSDFASSLPQDSCPDTDNATVNATATMPNGTVHDNVTRSPDQGPPATLQAEDPGDQGAKVHDSEDSDDPKPAAKKKNKYSGLLRLWMAMQQTICGKPPLSQDQFSDDMDLDDLGLTDKQKMDIGILVHVLYSNPKVLYAPNNTDTDRVIAKANESFALIDHISEYARKWLNVSAQIRDYLDQNSTEINLHDIRQMQREMRSFPMLLHLLANDTDMAAFLSNTSVARRAYFYQQLSNVDNAACSWLSLIDGISLNIFTGFRTERELVDYVLHQAYFDNVTVLASVVFTNVKEDGTLPPHIIYKIRQNATFTHDTRHVRPWYWFPGPMDWGYNYYQFGFVWVQDVMERAIIDITAGRDVVEPGSYIHQFPYPCYLEDRFLFMIEHVMPLCLTISWVYTVAMLVRNVVYEKEQRLKEVMKMMGLYNSVHWLAWLLTTFTQMSVTTGILTLMLHYGHVLQYSDPWLIFLTLQIFTMATISFSFLVSVLYSKAKLAAACAGIVYFLSYVPYMYVAIREEAAGDKIPAWAKTIASLFSTTAFGLGSKYFAFYEIVGVGVQWSNIYISPVESDEYNLFMVLLMMLFDTIMYGLLTWYIENVHPGSYGLPKPWYFPLTRSYWCGVHPRPDTPWRGCCCRGNTFSVMEEDQACAMVRAEDHGQNFEQEPSLLTLGVCIDGLTKRYKTGKLAVNGLSLNLFEGQITSFLGHNGAGKTTTMSILTGLFPPTSGYATIYGHDIRTEMEEIRKSLGMCPQHNVLFDKLTVEEHLWFYARLKGMPKADIPGEMETMIGDMAMVEKKNSTVDCLSGGMKRKLSVAIAFVAGSRTVILDEPTAGVDPYARRQIWDLLIKYKQDRTILLSTHHMDEADILGDRIAIISNGQLKCCGGSLFLKTMFGEGYHLTLVKAAIPDDTQSFDTVSQDLLSGTVPNATCSEATVTAFIVRYVSTAYIKSETTQELHYILPFEEAKKGCFEKLFSALDKNLSSLGVSSYGVADTNLEEVFLKVTEHALVTDDESEDDKLLQASSPPRSPNLAGGPADNQSQASSHSAASLLLDLDLGPGTPLTDLMTSGDNQMTSGDAGMTSPDGMRTSWDRTSDDPMVSLGEAGMTLGDAGIPSADGDRSPSQASARSDVSLLGAGDGVDQDSSSRDGDILPAGQEGRGSYTVQGHILLLQQFAAILVKRAVYIRRNWKGLFSQILLPALFVCVAMTVALTAPQVENPPPLVLSPAMYFNYTQPRGNYIPYSNMARTPEMPPWSQDASPSQLVQTFRLPSGVSATCVLRTPFNSSFDEAILRQLNFTYRNFQLLDQYFEPSCESVFQKGLPLENFVPPLPTDAPDTEGGKGKNHSRVTPVTESPVEHKFYPHCYCTTDSRSFICDKSGYDRPPFFQLVTSDIVQDISGDDEQKYYLHTTDMYRLHRYGAFSFGNEREFVPSDFGKDSTSLFRKLAVRRIAKIWYNHKGFHSIPAYLNTLNNAILRANLPQEKGNPAAYGITVINHPMDNTDPLHTYDYIMTGSDVLIAIFIIVAMSFVPASFVLFLVYERSIKAKHLQFVCGINRVIYWLANFTWDLCNYLIPALCCIVILKAFDIPAYVSEANFPAVISLFLLYGWSITPMMYPASFIFEEPSTAYIFLIVINLFIGITCLITSYLLEIFQLNDKNLAQYHETLKTVFLVFPNYCLGRGLMDIAFNEYQNEYFFKTGQYQKMKSPFEWNLTLRNLVAMAIIGFIFFLITLVCEFSYAFKYLKKRRGIAAPSSTPVDEDLDVTNERRRVLRGSGRRDVLRLENLTKIYTTRKLGRNLAVDRLCLGVPHGECFGMLGVNGAGKTTTFRMLTGDISPTAGTALLNEHSILKDMGRVQQNIGYCPQFDALYDELTAREHLQLYAKLRGVPYSQQAQVVDWVLRKMGLTELADKPSGTYSGGNKRKLSTAIVLVGHPPVIFLDEPTTGMDPHSRRFLWNLILDLVSNGRSIVLTSHSMEECEALCTRLAIMVNGRFKCLGSIQHLKTRFGDGYTVLLRVSGPEPDQQVVAVKRFMTRHFPQATLKECHFNVVQYELPSQNLSMAYLFSKMEEAARDLHIDDYSVNQNNLDNVFINFVKQQVEIQHEPQEVSASDPAPLGGSTPTELRPLSDEVLEEDEEDDVASRIDQAGTRLSFINMGVSDC